MENVGNVLAKDMAEVLDYLKQDFLPHNHFQRFVKNSLCFFDFWCFMCLLIFDVFCQVMQAAHHRKLDMHWATINGHMCGAPVWTSTFIKM